MATVKKENKDEATAGKKKSVSSNENASAEDAASEINAPRWSIVSFEKCVAKNLIYAEAVEKVEHLKAQKTAGLCIVTDEAAARISKQD